MKFLIDALAKFPVLVLLIVSALLMAAGDFFAKFWSMNGKISFFIIGFLVYTIAGLFICRPL